MTLSKSKIGTYYLTDNGLYRLETFNTSPKTVIGNPKYPARLGNIDGTHWERYTKDGKHYSFGRTNNNSIIKELSKEKYPEYFL